MNKFIGFCVGLGFILSAFLFRMSSKEIKEQAVKYDLEIAELKQHDESLALSQIALNEKFEILRKDFRDLDYQTDTLGHVVREIVEGGK